MLVFETPVHVWVVSDPEFVELSLRYKTNTINSGQKTPPISGAMLRHGFKFRMLACKHFSILPRHGCSCFLLSNRFVPEIWMERDVSLLHITGSWKTTSDKYNSGCCWLRLIRTSVMSSGCSLMKRVDTNSSVKMVKVGQQNPHTWKSSTSKYWLNTTKKFLVYKRQCA